MSFYEKLSQYYDIIFPLNQKSVDFINERVNRGSILDLGAGTGNHALALAKLGHKVTATDLDKYMIDKVIEKAVTNNIAIEAIQLPMEQLDLLNGRSFSTIICVGNSLVHLKDLDEVMQVINNTYLLLPKNGKLFIQIVNYDRVLHDGVTELPIIKREEEEITFKRTYKHKDDKIIFHGLLTVGNQTFKNEVSLLPITSDQLEIILKKAGFTSILKYGSYKAEVFSLHSPAIIIEATK